MDLHYLLGDDAESLLTHACTAFPKSLLTLPGPGFLDDVFVQSDRSPSVLRSLGSLYSHGRLGGAG